MSESLLITTKPGSGILERLELLGFSRVDTKRFDRFGGVKVGVFTRDGDDGKKATVFVTDSLYGNKRFQELSYDDCFGYITELAEQLREGKEGTVYCEVHGSDVEPVYSNYISSGVLPQYSTDDIKVSVFHHDAASGFYSGFMNNPFEELDEAKRFEPEVVFDTVIPPKVASQALGSVRGFLKGNENNEVDEGHVFEGRELLSYIGMYSGIDVEDMKALSVPLYVEVYDRKDLNRRTFYYFNHEVKDFIHIPLEVMDGMSDSPGFCFTLFSIKDKLKDNDLCLEYVKSLVQRLHRNEENEVFCCFDDIFLRMSDLKPDFKGFLSLSPKLLDEGVVMVNNPEMYLSVVAGRHSGTKGVIVAEGLEQVETIENHHWVRWIDLPSSLRRIEGESRSFSGDVLGSINIPEGIEILPEYYKDVPVVYKEKHHGFNDEIEPSAFECLRTRLGIIDKVSRDKCVEVVNDAFESLPSGFECVHIDSNYLKELELGKISRYYDPQEGDKISIEKYGDNIAVWVDHIRREPNHYDVFQDFPLVEVLTKAAMDPQLYFDRLYQLSGKALRELNDLSKEQCRYIDLVGDDVEILKELGASELDMHFLSRTGRLFFKALGLEFRVDEDRIVCMDIGKQMVPLKEVFDICNIIDESVSSKKGMRL